MNQGRYTQDQGQVGNVGADDIAHCDPALAGEDANWGRVVMAVGKTEEPVDRDSLAIRFGPHVAAIDGAPAPNYDEAKMSAYMKNAEIDITVDVGWGRASATVWTCDLTKRYVEINGDYRS